MVTVMRVANVMFSRGLGGIEQAFLDYNDALLTAGHEVLAVSHPVAEINTYIRGEVEHFTCGNIGSWDPFAAHRLKQIYTKWQPDIIISHGNRALQLNHKAKRGAFHIAVTHNYHLQHMHLVDGIFSITADLKQKAIEATGNTIPVQIIPNMTHLPDVTPKHDHSPLTIGALGRMIPKKGFRHLLDAAVILKQKGHQFRLILGGDGELLAELQSQAAQSSLDVEFRGWVRDKAAFFDDIDIFCLPSTHEPFGIVLLEAMAYGCPAVSFETEGPREIATHGEVLLATNEVSQSLATHLEMLLVSKEKRKEISEKARNLVETKYAMPVIAQKIDDVLQSWHTATKAA